MNAEHDQRIGRARMLGCVALGLGALLAAGAPAQVGGGRPDAAGQLDRGRALQRDGRLREAVAVYRQVAGSARDTDPAAAAIALNNACHALIELGEAEPALALCREAVALRRGLDDPRGLARSLNNAGRASSRLGRYEEAVVLTEEALAINRRRDDAPAQAINLINLGAIATQSGDYGAALDRYRHVRALTEAHADAPWARFQRQVATVNEGVVLERLGAYDEALVGYRGLMAEGEDLPAAQQLYLLTNLTTLYRNLGDPVRAVESIRQASAIAEAIGDRVGVAAAQLNLGLLLHRNLGQPKEAEAAYRDALARSLAVGDADLELETRLHLGDLERTSGRLGAARDLLEAALDRAEAGGAQDAMARSLSALARLDVARGEPAAALARLDRAMAIVEDMRAGIVRSDLRADLLGGRREAFAVAVWVLARMAAETPTGDQAARAFDLVQRAKHRTLLDSLGRGLPPQTAAELRPRLGDTTVLEFFVAEGSLLRWTLTAAGIALDDLGPAAAIATDVRTLHRALAAGAAPRATVVEQLSERLLGDLPNGAPTGGGARLVIAPDGLLHYLPFEVLALPTSPEVPLVERSTVTYVPSASLLARPTAPTASRPRLVAFGAPQEAEGELGGTARSLLRDRFALPPLAAPELDLVRDRIGGASVVLRGAEASESAFRRIASTDATIIHLATHTVADDRMQRGAAVLLAADAEHDGLLDPHEIAGLELRTQLCLLVACSTALGTEAEGRGLSSITGAFLAAGSDAVVATLWDVDDRAASVFMEQLYYQLARGRAPAEALRRAKLRMVRSSAWRQPSLWAAYILVGDTPPVIAVGPSMGRIALLGAAVLAAALLVALATARLRRRR